MAATTAVEPTAPADAEAAATGAFSASRPGQPVLSKRDLVTPVMVALILLGLYLNVRRQDLDSIESNVLNRDALTRATGEHIRVSLTIALLVVLVAVPLGVLVTRKTTRRLSPLVLGFANLGQAAPSLGLLALVGFYFIGFWAVVLILTAYAALSVLRNTIVGLQQVDPGVLDAARGMGMSPLSILLRVELPHRPGPRRRHRAARLRARRGRPRPAAVRRDQDEPATGDLHRRRDDRLPRPAPGLGRRRGPAGGDPARHPMSRPTAPRTSSARQHQPMHQKGIHR